MRLSRSYLSTSIFASVPTIRGDTIVFSIVAHTAGTGAFNSGKENDFGERGRALQRVANRLNRYLYSRYLTPGQHLSFSEFTVSKDVDHGCLLIHPKHIHQRATGAQDDRFFIPAYSIGAAAASFLSV